VEHIFCDRSRDYRLEAMFIAPEACHTPRFDGLLLGMCKKPGDVNAVPVVQLLCE
jgi:hypothetical protein